MRRKLNKATHVNRLTPHKISWIEGIMSLDFRPLDKWNIEVVFVFIAPYNLNFFYFYRNPLKKNEIRNQRYGVVKYTLKRLLTILRGRKLNPHST